MMAAANSIASTGIVLEPLRRDNYENWSNLVRNYLVGQGLWEGIVVSPPRDGEGDAEWTSKNAKALHAIQLACGSECLSYIGTSEDANDAWDFLKSIFSEEPETEAEPEPEPEPEAEAEAEAEAESADSTWINELHSSVEQGNWNVAKAYVRRHGYAATSCTRPPLRRTILHVAVASGRERIVEELLSMGNHSELEIQQVLRMQDKRGYTALALAAELTDNKDVAEWMLHKGGKEGKELLSIKTKDKGEIPILLAAAKGHKRMTRYLYSPTSDFIDGFVSSDDGALLFALCIYAEIFDVAAKLLTALGNSLAGQPMWLANAKMACSALACMPSAFHSGAQLGWWDQFIYNSYDTGSHGTPADEESALTPQIPSNDTGSHGTPVDEESASRPQIPSDDIGSHGTPASSRRFGQFPTSVLRIFPGSEKIYAMKLNHSLVHQILESLSKVVSKDYDKKDPRKCPVYDVMLLATKHGIIELIDSMMRANPSLLLDMNENQKSILAHAISYRQEKVFQCILGIQGPQKETLISHHTDWDGNNMVHLAAELGPSPYLNRLFNPALQMERELQWFKGVERIVPPKYKEAKNSNGMTPHEVFTKEHEDLMKAGEQWARGAASSFTLVGTLIVTIMFAAAFTVPGGNDQNTGKPIFLKRRAFLVFIIADTISLAMASSSVLIFIEILTLHSSMKDIPKSLRRMLWGLFTLFFSVTSMMLAFVAALSLMLEEYPIAIVAASLLASIPVLVFVHTLLRLSYEILKSTTWTPESGYTFSLLRKKNIQD